MYGRLYALQSALERRGGRSLQRGGGTAYGGQGRPAEEHRPELDPRGGEWTEVGGFAGCAHFSGAPDPDGIPGRPAAERAGGRTAGRPERRPDGRPAAAPGRTAAEGGGRRDGRRRPEMGGGRRMDPSDAPCVVRSGADPAEDRTRQARQAGNQGGDDGQRDGGRAGPAWIRNRCGEGALLGVEPPAREGGGPGKAAAGRGCYIMPKLAPRPCALPS